MKIHLISTAGLFFLSAVILCPLAIFFPHEAWWQIALILGALGLLHLAPACRRSWERRDELHRRLLQPGQQTLDTNPSALYRYWQTLPGGCLQGCEFRWHDAPQHEFCARLGVDAWLGLFSLPGQPECLEELELWVLSLREKCPLPAEWQERTASGIVFWRDGTLHLYPASLTPEFNRHFAHLLTPETTMENKSE